MFLLTIVLAAVRALCLAGQFLIIYCVTCSAQDFSICSSQWIGFAETQGLRRTMEDAHSIISNNELGYVFFGIFDGHGGREVADYVAQNLYKTLESHIAKNEYTITQALHRSFIDTHKDLDKQFFDANQQGCTVVTALIKNGILYSAHVGDSRAVIASAGRAIALSDDHKPDRPSEKKRIEQCGGTVITLPNDVPRVNGILAVTRAIGDKALFPYVIPNPEIGEKTLTSDDDFLILACDGVWDVIDNQQAVDIVKIILRQQNDYGKAADALKNAALERGSTDNISVMVVNLKK